MFFCAYTWVGYNPDVGGSWLYPRLMGLEAAKRFVYTGERWDAAKAKGRGLVSEVVPRDELAAAGARLAAELATGPSVAIGLAKGLLQTSSTRTLGEQLEAEKAAGLICAETDDHREALAAFAEKRVARVPRPLRRRTARAERLLRPRSVAFIGGGLAPVRPSDLPSTAASTGRCTPCIRATRARTAPFADLPEAPDAAFVGVNAQASRRRGRPAGGARRGRRRLLRGRVRRGGRRGARARAGRPRPGRWRCSARTATA